MYAWRVGGLALYFTSLYGRWVWEGDEWKSDHILRLMECRNIDSTKTQEQQKRRAAGQAELYKSNERKKERDQEFGQQWDVSVSWYLQHMTASVCAAACCPISKISTITLPSTLVYNYAQHTYNTNMDLLSSAFHLFLEHSLSSLFGT